MLKSKLKNFLKNLVFYISSFFLIVGTYLIYVSTIDIYNLTNFNKNISKKISLMNESSDFNDVDLEQIITTKKTNKTFKPIIKPKKIFSKNEVFQVNTKIVLEDFLNKDLNENKEKFIVKILPLIVRQNNLILLERQKLLNIHKYISNYNTLTKDHYNYIITLSKKYKIDYNNQHKIDIINNLLLRVDQIPNSIVLAQAANESGWGSSRFAKNYNALFGEYTYSYENGIIPNERSQGETFLIKFFDNQEESVKSYFLNINTHHAYSDFRRERQKQRLISNDLLNPFDLLHHLNGYAADKNYIKTLKSIITTNRLNKLDKFSDLDSLYS
ncbi:MAG: hypothetical protein CFH19_00368 [Alphaproteobacteria bacterium MarineAlpha5_Bin9]|nr:MAG: hypothetical protein CFH19_00368 [Alphaproteobacteria bacterium MarineAlpha5_Bin9]|tara:strand:+ start:2672 stop:3655 length:984 start_codon:yes stop_codon:yes gene_type:complete